MSQAPWTLPLVVTARVEVEIQLNDIAHVLFNNIGDNGSEGGRGMDNGCLQCFRVGL